MGEVLPRTNPLGTAPKPGTIAPLDTGGAVLGPTGLVPTAGTTQERIAQYNATLTPEERAAHQAAYDAAYGGDWGSTLTELAIYGGGAVATMVTAGAVAGAAGIVDTAALAGAGEAAGAGAAAVGEGAAAAGGGITLADVAGAVGTAGTLAGAGVKVAGALGVIGSKPPTAAPDYVAAPSSPTATATASSSSPRAERWETFPEWWRRVTAR